MEPIDTKQARLNPHYPSNKIQNIHTQQQKGMQKDHIASSQQFLQNHIEPIPHLLQNQQHQNQNQHRHNQNMKVNNGIIQQPPPNKIIIIQGNQTVELNNSSQNVIIINQNAKEKQDSAWRREQRIGCCCFSVHNQSCCFDYNCISKCCKSIQGCNLFCYCSNIDCIHCFIHHACRTCCFQKGICECMYQCCSRMPICMLFNCLKDCGCGANLCDCLVNVGGCCCKIIQNVGCICQLFKGCGCVSDIMCFVVDLVCCLCKQ